MNQYLDIFPTIRAAISGQPGLAGLIYPAVPYAQRPSRPAEVAPGRQANGRAGGRDVWSRPGEDRVAGARVSGWS
jgi:hypothetical protein